jgi:nitrous oxide reductase
VTLRSDIVLLPPGRDIVTRRRFLTTSAGVAAATAAGRASADTASGRAAAWDRSAAERAQPAIEVRAAQSHPGGGSGSAPC